MALSKVALYITEGSSLLPRNSAGSLQLQIVPAVGGMSVWSDEGGSG